MPHVFISYLRKDQELADRLRDDLVANGIEVWFDRNALTPGQNWKIAIREAIENGDFFIACFSSNYERARKSYMNHELRLAIEQLSLHPYNHIWFIPVLFDDSNIPDFPITGMGSFHDIEWVSMQPDWDKNIRKIVNVIKPVSKQVRIAIDELKSPYAEACLYALDVLIELKDTAAVPAIIQLLGEKNSRIKNAAAKALAAFGDKRAIKPLIDAYCQSESNTVQEAILTFNEYAVPALIDVLEDCKGVYRSYRSSLCEILGVLGDSRAIPVLTKFIEEGDYDNSVIEALVEIGELSSLPAIVRAFGDAHPLHYQNFPYRMTFNAFGKRIFPPLIEMLRNGSLRDRLGVVRVLSVCVGKFWDEDTLRMIINGLLDADWFVRYAFRKSLGGRESWDDVRRELTEALKRADRECGALIAEMIARDQLTHPEIEAWDKRTK